MLLISLLIKLRKEERILVMDKVKQHNVRTQKEKEHKIEKKYYKNKLSKSRRIISIQTKIISII